MRALWACRDACAHACRCGGNAAFDGYMPQALIDQGSKGIFLYSNKFHGVAMGKSPMSQYALWRPPLLFKDLDGNGKLDFVCVSRPSGQGMAMHSSPEAQLECDQVKLQVSGHTLIRQDMHTIESSSDIHVVVGDAKDVTIEAVSLSNIDTFNSGQFNFSKKGPFQLQAKKRGAATCLIAQDLHLYCKPGTRAAAAGAPCEPISPCSFVRNAKATQFSEMSSAFENGTVKVHFYLSLLSS